MHKIFILILIFGIFGCQKELKVDNFNVDIRDFDGAAGYMLNYKVNRDSLKIHYDCDFHGCKDSIIYAIKLNKIDTHNFYAYLKKQTTDTLKSSYKEAGFDGLNLYVNISGDSIKSKRIFLERYFHPEIEKLIIEIDKLIPENKYKFFREKYKK